MAIVKRSAPAEKPERQVGPRIPTVELPTKASVVSEDFRDFSMMVHGVRKWGKTSLFSHEKGSLFLEFDPLQRALSIIQMQIPDWPHALGVVKALEKQREDFPYPNIIVDRVDLMYLHCFKYACQKLGVDHPQDAGYGKGYDTIKREFMDLVTRIMSLPAPHRWICHSTWKEVEQHSGDKIEQLVPDYARGADAVLTGLFDITAAAVIVEDQRVLVIQPDERITAGHRVEGHFLTPDGVPVKEIWMGRSSSEGYDNLLKAFRNEQTYVTYDEKDSSERKSAPKKKMKLKLGKKK